MKIIGWNINGLRGKSMNLFTDNKLKDYNKDSNLQLLIDKYQPDVVCFGETKCQDCHTDLFNKLPFKYSTSICSRARKGYSGVCILSNIPFEDHGSLPLNDEDLEGRSRIVEFPECILIYTYTPNSGGRFDYRIEWDNIVFDYLKNMNKSDKPVIYSGDLNVVHTYNDICSDKTLDNASLPGTLFEERVRFNKYLNELKYVDIWRKNNPNKIQYTWFNPRIRARDTYQGWRIDYFLVRECDTEKIKDTKICDDIYGSDHVPIYIEI